MKTKLQFIIGRLAGQENVTVAASAHLIAVQPVAGKSGMRLILGKGRLHKGVSICGVEDKLCNRLREGQLSR